VTGTRNMNNKIPITIENTIDPIISFGTTLFLCADSNVGYKQSVYE
jgi:hypothetical protein